MKIFISLVSAICFGIYAEFGISVVLTSAIFTGFFALDLIINP